MDPLTHVATGVICSQLISSPSRWWAAVAGAVFALLPDVDYLFIFWDRLAFIRYHRGFTHSLVALPLFALAGALLGQITGGARWFKPLFIMGIVVLLSHLLLDLATSYGTQLLSPFSRQRFSLDWVFIIDPYFTALLLAGALGSLILPRWGPKMGAGFLGAAAIYLLVCALYHHQALVLARQVLQHRTPGVQTVAALPQPFSCRRWHLIAASPTEIQQAFVRLPFSAALGVRPQAEQVEVVSVTRNPRGQAPVPPYQDPRRLTVQTRRAAPLISNSYSPEAEVIVDSFLEFARFPLLHQNRISEGEQLLEWLDLRFSIPGRAFPFVLQLRLDAHDGRLRHWLIGRAGK